ncbi:LysM peptidoglycan-binding domain-containing protein [Candidatus Oscillochloris fontis]|uniref:LysM peptidoglycan-binding domain-containing protein n=1 Tax=Candidatus Oscillochloris fontis TaxID=2496868 RepID=UPI00101DDA8E|nr:LysM peptidoglycan-binding domain-containing protein [Candidatus Oscillochloris fontis]
MSELLAYLLLFLALVLPVFGAIGLRVIAPRLDQRQLLSATAALFALAMLSVLALSRSDVALIRIGDVSILLPGTHSGAPVVVPADLAPDGSDAPPPLPSVLPTLTPRPSATPTATATPLPTPTPTETPTPTPEPPTPTPEPPPGGRTYTVASGDSLRSIAEQFGVSIEAILQANNLTPAQGDALRVGQELIIP